jgi:shikimate kinase
MQLSANACQHRPLSKHRNGMNLRLKRTPGVYVVGFMASGKSTIGRALAHRLGWSFFDTDDEIEAAERTTIAKIFDARGEAEFRRIEALIVHQLVEWVQRGKPAVLALGGGAFVQPANRELLLAHGIAVWLDCPLDTVLRRVALAHHRPLARDLDKLAALYEARRQEYAKADLRIGIEGDDPAAVVDAILGHEIFR